MRQFVSCKLHAKAISAAISSRQSALYVPSTSHAADPSRPWAIGEEFPGNSQNLFPFKFQPNHGFNVLAEWNDVGEEDRTIFEAVRPLRSTTAWLNDQTVVSYLRTYMPSPNHIIIHPHHRASFPTASRRERSIFLESLGDQSPTRVVFLNNIGTRNVHWNVYVWDVPTKQFYLVDSLLPELFDDEDVKFMKTFLEKVWPAENWAR